MEKKILVADDDEAIQPGNGTQISNGITSKQSVRIRFHAKRVTHALP
jgi:hypothetical protein